MFSIRTAVSNRDKRGLGRDVHGLTQSGQKGGERPCQEAKLRLGTAGKRQACLYILTHSVTGGRGSTEKGSMGRQIKAYCLPLPPDTRRVYGAVDVV